MRFKEIDDFEGHFLITDCGKVWSNKSNKFLNQKKDVAGYMRITLSHKSFEKTLTVHRLVAIAFIENSENKKYVNHIDGIKSNNHFSNLEWVTLSENMKHARESNLIGKSKSRVSKLSKELVSKIKSLYIPKKLGPRKIAKLLEIEDVEIVKEIVRGNTGKTFD